MSLRSLGSQRTPLLLAAVFVYLPVLLLLLTTVIISSVKEIPIGNFIRDTTAVSRSPFYTGSISNIGIYLWCSTASICLFSYALIFRSNNQSNNKGFLLFSGLFTLILLLDDAFLIHEEVSPRYLNIEDKIIEGFYGLLMIAFLFYFRKIICSSNYILLLLALLFLSASLVVDVLQDNELLTPLGINSIDQQYLLEDGCKLLGIAGWFSYFAWHCYTRLLQHGNTRTTA